MITWIVSTTYKVHEVSSLITSAFEMRNQASEVIMRTSHNQESEISGSVNEESEKINDIGQGCFQNIFQENLP